MTMCKLQDNKDTLEQLNKISDDLNTTTTELNEMLKSIENNLIEMKLGVSAWTESTIKIPSTNGGNVEYKLGFCRIKDEWKLVCQKVDGHTGRLIPLLYSSRIIRMEACKSIDELLARLIEKASKFLSDVHDVKTILDESPMIKYVLKEEVPTNDGEEIKQDEE